MRGRKAKYNALMREGWFGRKKHEAKEAHPLVSLLKGREHIGKLSEQVDRVIPGDKIGPPEPQQALEKLFEEYAKSSPEWQKISKEERILDEVRNANILTVNEAQEAFLRGKRDDQGRLLFPTDERFSSAEAKAHRSIDLYVRLDPKHKIKGEMDEFQMAIVAQTVQQYISGGHSRLFDRIRVLPAARTSEMVSGSVAETMIPRSVLLAAGDAQFLNVAGNAFKDSMPFSNRMGLTVWSASEAIHRGSIPIVGWTTYQSRYKPSPKDVVVFRGTFNADDPAYKDIKVFPSSVVRAGVVLKTGGRVRYRDTEVAGNITGLINETLRCLREVEEREIARAQKG